MCPRRPSTAVLPLVAVVVLGACGDRVDGPIALASASCSVAQEQIEDLGRPVDLVDFGGHAADAEAILAGLGRELDGLAAEGDDGEALAAVAEHLDNVAEALATARRASAIGDMEAAHDRWADAQTGEVAGGDARPWWRDDSATVARDAGLGDCVLDLAVIEPGVEATPVNQPTVTEPSGTEPSVTEPSTTEPSTTEPPTTGPVEPTIFTILDPTVTLLAPDGLSWYAYDEPSYAEFFDSLTRSEFAEQLEGVTVGELYDSATEEYAMLVREFYWVGEVAGTELATSLDDVYLQGVAESRPKVIGGIEGTYYVEDDGTSGWVGHVGTYSIVLQYSAGAEPGASSDAYVALNYG